MTKKTTCYHLYGARMLTVGMPFIGRDVKSASLKLHIWSSYSSPW